MAFHRVAKFCTLFLLQVFLLLPMIAFGQYNIMRSYATADLTSQATSGTNAWNYIAGTPQCKLQSLAIGYDLSAWCLGINDNIPYKFNPQTKQWDKHAEMGNGVVALIVQASSNIYAMKQESHCGIAGGHQFYALVHWNGSNQWTEPDTSACATNYSVTIDGTLAQVGWDGPNNIQALYYSKDSGASWTFWSDGWTFVNLSEAEHGCAINTSGTIYQVGLTTPDIFQVAIPSGNAAGCVITQSNDLAFIAWNTAGTVYLLNSDGSAWQPISGLSANQVVAVDKGDVLALDLSGKPYHWNVYAPSVTATVGGTFDKFPMDLNPTPHHTSHIKINFPHGLNTAAASAQTIPYNGAMSNSYTDTGNLCDLYWVGEDSECQPVTTDDATCSVAGALAVGGAEASLSWGVSIDNVEWTSNNGFTGATMEGNGTTGDWIGYVRSKTQDACGLTGGTPTCPQPVGASVRDRIYFFWWDDPTGTVEQTVGYNWVTDQMAIDIDGGYSPWVMFQGYVVDNGVTICQGVRPGISYKGDYFLMPACQ